MIQKMVPVLFLFIGLPAVLAERELAVTVYNQDFGVVKDTREFQTPNGTGLLTFTDVAARIDPTSVQITNPGNPNFTVREQNYENNLVSGEKLLEKMIDKPITALLEDGKSFTGQLLSAESGALTLQTADGVKIIDRNERFSQIVLPALPDGLLLKPTLVWQVANGMGKQEKIQVTYQTAGMNWTASYNVLVRPEKKLLDINGWVTMINGSGSRYPDAHLKLVAGEVHKVKPEENLARPMMMKARGEMMDMAAAPAGFQERAFAEYHLYDLGRTTTLEDNETKQIELFDVRDISYVTEYLFEDSQMYPIYEDQYGGPPTTGEDKGQPLKVVATIENKKENKLGIPLPAGQVRIYQEDTQKADHLIGQDSIEHTPKDEKVRLTIGRAFDVVGGKKRVSMNRIDNNTFTQDIVIRIRNHKAGPVSIVVRDLFLPYMNWTIEQSSETYRKTDYRTVEFKFNLSGNSEKQIKYRVRYEQERW